LLTFEAKSNKILTYRFSNPNEIGICCTFSKRKPTTPKFPVPKSKDTVLFNFFYFIYIFFSSNVSFISVFLFVALHRLAFYLGFVNNLCLFIIDFPAFLRAHSYANFLSGAFHHGKSHTPLAIIIIIRLCCRFFCTFYF